jgi:hypothetical protein
MGVDRAEADDEVERDEDRRQTDELALPDRTHGSPRARPRWRGDI